MELPEKTMLKDIKETFERKLKKLEDGWAFPVPDRKPVLLSNLLL